MKKSKKISGFCFFAIEFIETLMPSCPADDWNWFMDKICKVKNVSNTDKKYFLEYLIYNHFKDWPYGDGQTNAADIIYNFNGRKVLEKALENESFSSEQKYYLQNIYILVLEKLYIRYKNKRTQRKLAEKILEIIIDLEVYHHTIEDGGIAVDYDEAVEMISQVGATDIIVEKVAASNPCSTIWQEMRVKKFIEDCRKAEIAPTD